MPVTSSTPEKEGMKLKNRLLQSSTSESRPYSNFTSKEEELVHGKPLGKRKLSNSLMETETLSYSSDNSDVSSNENSLTIAVQLKKQKKNPVLTINDVPQDLQDIINMSGIDDILEEKAKKTKLSTSQVKNILKQLIVNPDVTSFTRNLIDGNDDNLTTFEPKYTRAKTKELLEQHIKETGGDVGSHALLNNSASAQPYPEAHTVASGEFPEDDSDDDYDPAVDHTGDKSEDESSLATPHGTPRTPSQSISVVTPSSGRFSCENKSRITPSFVLPNQTNENLARAVQRSLDFTKPAEKTPELISTRTRSRCPMTDTPLEHLQLYFRQLPIKKDKFMDTVFDEDYSEFMKELPAVNPENLLTADDDEMSDPDFNVMDHTHIGKMDLHEEIRNDKGVNVGKKEYSQMMTEFLDGFQHDLYDLNDSASSTTSNLNSNEQPTIETEFFNSANTHYSCVTPRCDSANSSVHHNMYETQINGPQFEKNSSSMENNNVEIQTPISINLPPTVPILVHFMIPRLSPYQLNGLKVQMMQHIQLLTNSILLTHKCEFWDYVSTSSRKMINQICTTANESSNTSQSIFNPWNLKASIDTLAVYDNNQNLDDKYPLKSFRKSRNIFTKLLKFVYLNSYAFPFVHLLPKYKYCQYKSQSIKDPKSKEITFDRRFMDGEDWLLTQALHSLVTGEDKNEYKGKLFMTQKLAQKISKNGILLKSRKAIFLRMKFLRRKERGSGWDDNPVRKYMKYDIYETLPLMQKAPDYTPCALKNVPELANLPPLWVRMKAKYWAENYKKKPEDDATSANASTVADSGDSDFPLYMVVYPNTNTSAETPVVSSQSQPDQFVKAPQTKMAATEIASSPSYLPLCFVSDADPSVPETPSCTVASGNACQPMSGECSSILADEASIADFTDDDNEPSLPKVGALLKGFPHSAAVDVPSDTYAPPLYPPRGKYLQHSAQCTNTGNSPSQSVKPTPNTSSVGQSDASGSNFSFSAIVEGLNDMPFLMTTPSKAPCSMATESMETPVIACNDSMAHHTPWKTSREDSSAIVSRQSTNLRRDVVKNSATILSPALPITKEPRRITRQMARSSKQLLQSPVESQNSSDHDTNFENSECINEVSGPEVMKEEPDFGEDDMTTSVPEELIQSPVESQNSSDDDINFGDTDSVDEANETDIVKHELDFEEYDTSTTVSSFASSEISDGMTPLHSNFNSPSGVSYSKKENAHSKKSNFWECTKEILLPNHDSVFQKLKSTLSQFDSCRVAPEKLFLKVEQVLRDFPMLVNEFLLFLKPQEAMNISKYNEYCAAFRLNHFLTRLKSHAVKALQIQALVDPVRTMQKRGMSPREITSIKLRLAPILQCPHLLDIFEKCFHSPPPLSDFGQISIEYKATLKSSCCSKLLAKRRFNQEAA